MPNEIREIEVYGDDTKHLVEIVCGDERLNNSCFTFVGVGEHKFWRKLKFSHDKQNIFTPKMLDEKNKDHYVAFARPYKKIKKKIG